MKAKWPALLAWAFLALLILLFLGWIEFSWKLTKVLPFFITCLFLFFQVLTISKINSGTFRIINRGLLIAQVLLLGFFLLSMVEIRSIWKINMLLLLAATHIYLLDLNNRYIQTRVFSKWLLLFLLVISLVAFLFVQQSPYLMNVGFTSAIISGLVVLMNIFLFNPKKEGSSD
ncbi:hypothetical protein [Fluviicola taffensis]|uniref:Transglutaminase family protein n=1 Tax=Fluviicola taffensis (strain DSM 16823 / NCIMB 13979 / RW262) TaxID=755732 RepID=F2IEP6_FLUTR|nr:hypothetical protein [Fluviicola taffensis]AEA45613.1 transglutaminase family protein [Fluviicola taffensis DSM 16823]